MKGETTDCISLSLTLPLSHMKYFFDSHSITLPPQYNPIRHGFGSSYGAVQPQKGENLQAMPSSQNFGTFSFLFCFVVLSFFFQFFGVQDTFWFIISS